MMRYEQAIRSRFEVHSQHGTEFLCRCPFHDDRGRPNLYANGEKGVFLCHACSARGSLGKPEPHADDIRRRLRATLTESDPGVRTYPEKWLRQFNHPHPFWTEERGLLPRTVKLFGLGYDPLTNTGTIPIRDRHGRIYGVLRRAIEKGTRPKYLHPAGLKTSNFLHGAWLLNGQTKVALTEGPLDAIACWDSRVPALALYGARISEAQHTLLHLLGVQHIVIMTDADEAGRVAAEQIAEAVRGIQVSVGIYRYYWTAKDPGELTPQQTRKMFHSAKRLKLG